ncbi:MAG: PAS domain S-box protein [Hydrogenophaga sp.]|nr:PAS domain S-box protein [Hydrogenophaga sp.]
MQTELAALQQASETGNEPPAEPTPADGVNGLSAPYVEDRPDALQQYLSLIEALPTVHPIGVFMADVSGQLQLADPTLQAILGGSPEDGVAADWFRLVHPDDAERLQRAWHAAVSRDDTLAIEFRLLRPDGREVHLLMRKPAAQPGAVRAAGQVGFVQDITELRTLQADARIKDDLNRQIIASSPDCTKVLDLQGRVLQMTSQGCRLVEVDDFETVRLSDWCSWWPPEGAALARSAIERAARGESARFVAMGVTFKGTEKWWDTVISPISGPDGQAVMLLAVSRDVSDLQRQQEEILQLNVQLESRVHRRTRELAEANERIRATLDEAQLLYDRAPCGYHSVDASGLYVLMNQTELDWLGYTRDEVVNRMSFRDILLPAYLPEVEGRLDQLLTLGRLDAAELGMRRRDGSEFLVLISSTAVFDPEGRFVRSNSTLVDITARKVAELALKAQQTFLQTITNSVPVQLAFYDPSLICRFANASYARWIRGSPEHVIGRHLSEVARPEDFARAQPYLASALSGEPQRFEGPRVFPDGQAFYASIEYTPYVEDGAVRGIVIQMLDITRRKASEDQVQEANAQLNTALAQARQLYNQAPCGYHSLNIDGVYVSINDTELDWLGYSREEVVGHKRFADFILPSRRPMLEERLRRLIVDGELEGSEYEIRRRDGSIFQALLSSSAVRDAQGRFLRSNTTVVDITQRKHAELALQDNQRFLRGITDHVPGLLAYLDVMLRYRFANAEHLHVYGLDPERIMGLHASECLPPEVWTDMVSRLERVLKGESQYHETWRRDATGTPRYVREACLPDIHDGLVQGVFVQIIDITDRKRVEERVSQLNEELECRIRERSAELLESEQRFRLMVDNLREYCIFFLDADGHITDWTDSAQRLEGYAPSEMLGRHYAVLFGAENSVPALAQANQILRLAASRGQHELTNWHTRKDGSRYWSHSLLIALRDAGGELRGFAKINRDMSDAKRLDDLMRNINDELENRVAERTEQLLAANQDLESFSYSVSHDLRSPLRHISSFVSLLEEHLGPEADEVSGRYLSTIGNSARHMSQLIDGLLAFSRLGRAAVNLAPVDFTLLVGAVVGQLAHDTEGRVVDWVVAQDLPVVQGDALLLREVWANLLGNAFKYTRPRERARIEVGWSVDPAVGYTFFVRDNGVGFDTKYSTKLFGVFQRLHRASEFEGTGIGLALTRRIVERHGGSTWAESQLGEGSVFYFSLPFEGLHPLDSPCESRYPALEP